MPRSLVPQLNTALPEYRQALLHRLAALATELGLQPYIVGGFVRDLLLGRPSLDLDIVIEGDALIFAAQVVAKLGGQTVTHSKFHTATWNPPDDSEPAIDLVSARRETYARPAALPDVTLSTIADDLARRDFTLNTLALRLDGEHFGEILDLHNGEQDLQDGLVRVLHPNSFIDDPTRLFRAVRYEQRFGFQIAPDTLALIRYARDLINDLSDDRIRHELELILEEPEPNRCLNRVEALGLLTAVLPFFTVPKTEIRLSSWAALISHLTPNQIQMVKERLNIGSKESTFIDQVAVARRLLKKPWNRATPSSNSALSEFHKAAQALSLEALTLAAALEAPNVNNQSLIITYLNRRSAMQLTTNGDDIAALGLPPGPAYKNLRLQLECAYLEGEINSPEEERALLQKLVVEANSFVRVDPQHPQAGPIQRAAQLIRSGKLVAFPTETVYGLGANALDAEAVARIFEAKKRPATDPLIVHISRMEQLSELALDIPDLAYQLAREFWPGPLTLVLKRQPNVPSNLSGGRDTIAIRQPAHPVAVALIEAAGVPIAAPSANLFSHPSPTTAEHVHQDLQGRIDLILDGGPTTVGVESTVLDLTGAMPTVLRPGGVSVEELQRLIPNVAVTQQILSEHEAASAPGQLLKHYSPNAKVLLFSGPREATLKAIRQTVKEQLAEGKTLGLLLSHEDADSLSDLNIPIYPLGSLTDLAAIAHNLYTGLRDLDAEGLDFIVTRDWGREGLGLAIWDRLFRAAEGKVISVE